MTDIPDLNQLRYGTDPGRIDEPSETKKDNGYVTRESPSPTLWNWSRNKTFERLKSLQGNENHIIIGDSAQKTNLVADLLIAELLDAVTEVGDKIALLNGTHALSAAKNLSDHDLELRCQSSLSQIDLNGYILTLSGDRLRGQLNITNSVPNSLVISGGGVESLYIRIDDPDAVNFIGSGSIIVNGKVISSQAVLLEISNQPDRVIMTASEQSLYSNDDRFVRYDQATQTFKRRDDTLVTISDGFWVIIKSLETLTIDDLLFDADRLKIESYRGFQLDLGDQGDNIPYAVFVKGDSCQVDLHMTQSLRDLAELLGDDKFIPMSNGLTAMENRRVIKNQGEGNRINYNAQQIFSGGPPVAALDFVRLNHPYFLEWDSFIYQGLLRYPSFDNREMCFFTDLYYWLDRRFNAQLLNPDSTLAYHLITVPPRSNNFLRPLNITDADRHSRTKNLGEVDDTILLAEFSQIADKILLGTNAAINIKNVKNGQRVTATGLPIAPSGTTIVRPGSIVTDPGSESFLMMDAQTNAPVTLSATSNLTLNFSGMAAGSFQEDTFQNINADFSVHTFYDSAVPAGINLVFGTSGSFSQFLDGTKTHRTVDLTVNTSPNLNYLQDVNLNTANDTNLRTGTETRAKNSLVIPYYKL